MHSGSDDHLKLQSSVIGSYPQWQVKEPQGPYKCSSLSLYRPVRGMSVTYRGCCGLSEASVLLLCHQGSLDLAEKGWKGFFPN